MDQLRKVAKPARGQLNKEIKCPCRDASVVSTYICTGAVLLFVFVYIPGIFLFGDMYICARFTAVYGYMCNLYVWPSQPGKVANPARGQLAEQVKWIIPCPRSRLRIWSRETGSAVPSRVSLLISILQAESSASLRDSSRVPRRRPL